MKNHIKSFTSKFYTCIFCALCLCSFSAPNANAAVSSIIIDANSGDVISTNNADTLRYPASLTKVMTLYITFDALDKGLLKLNDKLPVSRTAANRSPSKLGVKAGSNISVKTAINAVIIKSANDCATVLAEGLGYNEENFAQTMTKVAHELGMKNTTFKNASGLPHKEQKTTARDMAILAAAMYHHFPQYYKLFSMKSFSYEGRTYYTHNHILKSFQGADGMKTGYTNAAGYNIITSAQRSGQRVIAVTMGHNTIKERDKKVSQMMNNGLTKLSLSNNVKSSNMYAEIIEQPSHIKTSKLAKAEDLPDVYESADNTNIEQGSADSKEILSGTISDNWAIQVGAFSNYSKARNYAIQVQKKNLKTFRDTSVNVEAFATSSAIVYRSKITGFAKNDANEACKRLKKSKMSCIVVSNDSNHNSLTVAAR